MDTTIVWHNIMFEYKKSMMQTSTYILSLIIVRIIQVHRYIQEQFIDRS